MFLAYFFQPDALPGAVASKGCLSPNASIVGKDGQTLFMACGTANCVLTIDVDTGQVRNSFAVPGNPTGIAISQDGKQLYVTSASAGSQLLIVDVETGTIQKTIPAGHTAMAPVVSANGKTLYVCNRLENEICEIDLALCRVLRRIPVQREPVAVDLTRDGTFLLVANHLQAGRADVAELGAVVSVIDTKLGEVVKELKLPNGSGILNDLRVSPDGRYVIVTHLISRFDRPTDHLYRGWMNSNAATLIDLERMEVWNTIFLDNPTSGAANPWSIAWSDDGKTAVITHAGTHEISIIDLPELTSRLPRLTSKKGLVASEFGEPVPLAIQSSSLGGACKRVRLPAGDLGPRAVTIVGHVAYVANYFSDSLSRVDLTPPYQTESIPLGPKREMDLVRKGEFYFNDAGICLQGWQSCASCHPSDARSDGLNWDLLNDGMGNPKNTKSLLLAHKTPPAMSLGVRDTAETAVRSGIRHILFTEQPEEVAVAIDEYLKSLKPVPSPFLVNGGLSESAKRGERVFEKADCSGCHTPGLYTNLRQYDVGTRGRFDKSTDRFDTPTLIELWRTAPYLHDGSAETVREVLTTRNPNDRHGVISNLSSKEIDDLCAYLLSL